MSKKERELSNTARDNATRVTNANPLEKAHLAVIQAFAAPLSAEDQALATFERTYELAHGAPETKRAAIEGEFARFATKVTELRRNLDGHGLLKETVALYRSIVELSRPLPAPSAPLNYDHAMSMYQAWLVARWGNSTLASMACTEAVRRKSAITDVDATGVTFADGERVLRSWLISVNAPREEPFKSRFLAQFPPIGGEHSEVKENA